jgi:hypothetical protein
VLRGVSPRIAPLDAGHRWVRQAGRALWQIAEALLGHRDKHGGRRTSEQLRVGRPGDVLPEGGQQRAAHRVRQLEHLGRAASA